MNLAAATVRGVTAIAVAVPIAGCLDTLGPGSDATTVPSVLAWTTGAALANLDSEGHFRFPTPKSPDELPIITLEFAGALTLGVVRTWIANPDVITLPGTVSIRAGLEETHGAAVDWDRAELGFRTGYFSMSPFAPLPADAPGSDHRSFGSHYLVPVYVDGVQVLSLGVASYNPEVRILPNGFVRLPLISGNEWSAHGVPRGLHFSIPPAPEAAVTFAAKALGAKVSQVPTLIRPRRGMAPHAGRWQLDLDQTVDVRRRSDQRVVQLKRLYVGVSFVENGEGDLRFRLFMPSETQPAADTARFFRDTSRTELIEVEVARILDIPIDFLEVDPARN